MITKMFSVFDSKAGYWLPPFLFKSTGEAVRAFQDTANDAGHQFHRHAGDFSLFEIGEFDDAGGRVNMHDAPINLGTALEHQRVEVESAPEFLKPNTNGVHEHA